jgi:hypothetical protein
MKKISAEDLILNLEKYDYNQFHVHHTWKPNHNDFNGGNHLALQKGMKNYHVNTLGWNDIGQHISVFPDGAIVTGRDFSKTPASIRGHNTGAFAMEIIGNFDKGNDELAGKQLISVLKITKHFIDANVDVVFHREHSNKTCPGTSVNKKTFIKLANQINNISDWAIDSWKKAIDKNITDGSRPNEFMTREQFATMIDRLGLL